MAEEDRDQLDGLEKDYSLDINIAEFLEEPIQVKLEEDKIADPRADANLIGEQRCKPVAGVTGVQNSFPVPVLNVTNNPSAVASSNIAVGGHLSQILANPTENDTLVDSLRNEDPTQTVMNNIMVEIAEEASYLKAWRNTQWAANPGSEDLSEATLRRIKMLSDLVETLMKKERLIKEKDVGKVDFYGDNFKHVLKYFLQVISETFKKVHIPEQYNDIFFAQLAKEFDGFEKKAEKIYYNKQAKK